MVGWKITPETLWSTRTPLSLAPLLLCFYFLGTREASDWDVRQFMSWAGPANGSKNNLGDRKDKVLCKRITRTSMAETQRKLIFSSQPFSPLFSPLSTLLVKVMKISSIRLEKQYKYLIQSILPNTVTLKYLTDCRFIKEHSHQNGQWCLSILTIKLLGK